MPSQKKISIPGSVKQPLPVHTSSPQLPQMSGLRSRFGFGLRMLCLAHKIC